MNHHSLGSKINRISRLQGSFKLRSGEISDTYFDKYRFESEPEVLREVARSMLELIPSETEILAGLELGGVPIVTAMSLESGLPAVFIRKAAKQYGTCQAIEGREVQGRKIVLIEDVITTGGAVADAIELVSDAGADILAVVCAIWRGEGSPHIVGLPDLSVRALLTKEDLHG